MSICKNRTELMLSMGQSLQKTKLKYSNDIKALDGAVELM